MLFDRAMRLTVRNFSTIFLVLFVILMPLHLLYAFAFHDVLAVRELHPAIAEFPANRQVKGVGQSDIARARLWFWVLAAVELALLPLFARAVRRVLVLDQQGLVPDAVSAWRSRNEPGVVRGAASTAKVRTATAAVAVGIAVGILVWLSLVRLADLFPPSAAAFVLGASDAAARATGAAFALVGLVLSIPPRRAEVDLKL